MQQEHRWPVFGWSCHPSLSCTVATKTDNEDEVTRLYQHRNDTAMTDYDRVRRPMFQGGPVSEERVHVALEQKVTFHRGHCVFSGGIVLGRLLPLSVHGSRRRIVRIYTFSKYAQLSAGFTIGTISGGSCSQAFW